MPTDADKMVPYSTTDIYFAAYLCALDVPLVRTEKDDESKASRWKRLTFVFTVPHKDIEHLKASFFGGSGTVKAKKFCNCLKDLKSMCYV